MFFSHSPFLSLRRLPVLLPAPLTEVIISRERAAEFKHWLDQ